MYKKIQDVHQCSRITIKYKGFSKLPEKVQEKIDTNLAQKYEKGGEVKKKKGNSKKNGVCRGAGAAVRGTRFSGVR